MNKKFTDEEIVKAAEHCIACKGVCNENCPLIDEPTACEFIFAHHIVDTAEPKFDWDGFIGGKFNVRLKTQTDYDTFMRECEQRELNWGPEKPTEVNTWPYYRDYTSIHCWPKDKNLSYGDYSSSQIPVVVYSDKQTDSHAKVSLIGKEFNKFLLDIAELLSTMDKQCTAAYNAGISCQRLKSLIRSDGEQND